MEKNKYLCEVLYEVAGVLLGRKTQYDIVIDRDGDVAVISLNSEADKAYGLLEDDYLDLVYSYFSQDVTKHEAIKKISQMVNKSEFLKKLENKS
jgi:hypothetical protein